MKNKYNMMIPVIYRIMGVCDKIYYLQFSSFFFSDTAVDDDGWIIYRMEVEVE